MQVSDLLPYSSYHGGAYIRDFVAGVKEFGAANPNDATQRPAVAYVLLKFLMHFVFPVELLTAGLSLISPLCIALENRLQSTHVLPLTLFVTFVGACSVLVAAGRTSYSMRAQ